MNARWEGVQVCLNLLQLGKPGPKEGSRRGNLSILMLRSLIAMLLATQCLHALTPEASANLLIIVNCLLPLIMCKV